MNPEKPSENLEEALKRLGEKIERAKALTPRSLPSEHHTTSPDGEVVDLRKTKKEFPVPKQKPIYKRSTRAGRIGDALDKKEDDLENRLQEIKKAKEQGLAS